ncbi:molybdopterin-dependent oxidoreductase [Massilia terrae]|uniref:Molybdopterin-dependent oxidoreductase n=2 Tax=Massilia terrae TaxID=1811224 RepID=A0ABT2CU56_9BURK|nr:molybdopterin-dependent oxidoreductase [Massilia terrae]MCS0657513.1 molybdopterin-dependent oxidoreductase [Massilia terrae]
MGSDSMDPHGRRRRAVMRQAGTLGAAAALGALGRDALAANKTVNLGFENGERELVAFPQKRPMILLTSRPPQLETPFGIFNDNIITPNDAFFVRYHWSGIPTSIDPGTFRLHVGGNVNSPLELSLAELKQMGGADVVAVNQCSGNSRGFFQPRVNGGQLGNGAMGNARWAGVPLKLVLERAGVKAGSVQVSFNGMDMPPVPGGPDFIKALDIDHALDGEVLLAWQMNNADLPVLNGYPLRLVVPGYYGTYWVKHVNDIQVLDKVFDGFWMANAYRIPDNSCACIQPGTAMAKTTPIKRFDVRSFITSLADGAQVKAGQSVVVKGIAFDGGYGIADVALSLDGGRTWMETRLGQDLGRFSFREWSATVRLPKGRHELKVRAVNRIGQSQPMTALWNPPGYMRNVVETTRVVAV